MPDTILELLKQNSALYAEGKSLQKDVFCFDASGVHAGGPSNGQVPWESRSFTFTMPEKVPSCPIGMPYEVGTMTDHLGAVFLQHPVGNSQGAAEVKEENTSIKKTL